MGKPKLSKEQKIKRAEELLERAELVEFSYAPFAYIDAIFREGLSLAPKNGQLTSNLHLQRGLLLLDHSRDKELDSKTSKKMYKEFQKEVDLAVKADPTNLRAQYSSEMRKIKSIKNEEKKSAFEKSSMEKILASPATTFEDHDAHALALYRLQGPAAELAKCQEILQKPQFAADYRVHVRVARIYAEQGKYIEAAASYGEAMKHNPEYLGWTSLGFMVSEQAELLSIEGYADASREKYEESEAYFRRAIDAKQRQNLPLDKKTLGQLGHVLSCLGKYEESLPFAKMRLELFGETLETCKGYAVSLTNIQYADFEEGQAAHKEALVYVEKALVIKPDNIIALVSRARVLGGIEGRLSDALEAANYVYNLIRKNKDALDEFEGLHWHQKEIVELMLTDTREELMRMLNHDQDLEDYSTINTSVNPATQLLVQELQEKKQELDRSKAGIVQDAFDIHKAGSSDALLQRAVDYEASEKVYNQEVASKRMTAAELDEAVYQLRCTDIQSYQYYSAFTEVITGIRIVASTETTGLRKLQDKSMLGTFSQLLMFAPMGGQHLKSLLQFISGKISTHQLHEKLNKLLDVADLNTFSRILTEVALKVTHAKSAEIHDATPKTVDSSVKALLKSATKTLKCDFKAKALNTPEKKLGGIDAAKFLDAIYNDKVSSSPAETFTERMSEYVLGVDRGAQSSGAAKGFFLETLGNICDLAGEMA